MSRHFAALAVLLGGVGLVRAGVPFVHPPGVMPAAAPAGVQWSGLAAVLDGAAAGDRAIVVEVFKPACEFCTRLHEEVWHDERVATLLGRVARARVDISTPSGGQLAVRFKVDLFPTILTIDANGALLDRINGMPELAAIREFLERAAARRTSPPADPRARIAAGDFAAEVGAFALAEARFQQVVDDPEVSPDIADNARLWSARTKERRGDRSGAAAMLEKFTGGASSPGPVTRPALDLLIRLRKALGDQDGEARARAAFARLYPALPAPG